jgi:ABC-type nickel/cobalt efflux system permease component RcnA
MGRLSAILALLLMAPGLGRAHLVLPDNHDRVIVVHLAADPELGQVVIRVEYRLEVNENLAIYTDLPAVADKLDLSEFRAQRGRFFKEFTRCYAPIIGRNLDARLDGQSLPLSCVRFSHTLKDEKGTNLGHLRCDFVYEARKNVEPGEHQFSFKEGNYQEAAGLVLLSFAPQQTLKLVKLQAPTAALQAKHPTELTGKEEALLRIVEATFSIPSATGVRPATDDNARTGRPAPVSPTPRGEPGNKDLNQADVDGGGDDHLSLRDLFLHSNHGIVLLLVLAFGIGAVHALTPGHGKTLVAAYLVGERGTVWHAVLLGLVTTLTHTGVVFVLAIALNWMSREAQRSVLEALPLVGGAIVVLVGFWLLLRRLAGQADHFHFGSHSHHHHHHNGAGHHHDHGPADHYHDEHGHVHALPSAKQPVGWWGLVLLGISGGIVPCIDAVIMLILAAAMNLLWLAVPMLLAFSAGLAGVLVLVGILVVKAKTIAEGRWGESRFFRALPVLSAVVVMGLGVWLCLDGVNAIR